MYQRRRARILLAVLSLVSLVLITIDFRSNGGEGGVLGTLRSVATSAFAPVQDGVAVLVRPIGDVASSVTDVFQLREENAELRDRLSELDRRRQSLRDLERENADLRALVGMRSSIEAETIPARTIALAPSNYEWTISIDVGSGDGVQRDMPVVNGRGLVGRVIQVTPNAARVLLAIDPNFSAAAQLSSSGEKGSIDGKGGDLMRLRPLDPEAGVEVGDEVVTSSYSNGLYPPGIPIGTVEEAGEPTTRLDREVLVRPYVDFTRLDLLLVVKHEPVAEPPALGDLDDAPFTPPRVDPGPTTPPGEAGTAPPREAPATESPPTDQAAAQ